MTKKKYKLLIVYDVSYPSIDGGGQRRLFEIASRLINLKNVEIDWVCFKTWENGDINKYSSQINYIGIPGFKGLYNQSGSRRKLEPLEFLISLYRAKINYSKYDVIWSGQWPILHLISWSFKKDIRNKLIVDWWEYWGNTWFSYSRLIGWLGYFIEKFVLRRIAQYSKIITISETAELEIKNLLKSPENIALINNGIDSKELYTIQENSNKIYDIGYLGRLKDHKRVDLLIRAVKWAETNNGLKFSLLIIGDGPEKKKLYDLSVDLGLKDRIYFKGAIKSNKEVYQSLAQCSIFVNPSTKEGGGSITLFEAFALGLPSIAFDCKDGIDPSLIGNNSRGLLVHEVSHKELGKSISTLVSNKCMVNEMSNNALVYANYYDWDTIALLYSEIFQEIRTR